jgi:hypothetical protein
MAKKQQHKSIKLGHFPLWLEVYIGGQITDVPVKRLIKKFGISEDLEIWTTKETNANGRIFMSLDSQTIIMWVKSLDPAIIAHEAVHVAFFANERLGGLFTPESQESCTYLVEHIVREIFKKKHGKAS